MTVLTVNPLTRIASRRVVASVSGGKDSVAASLRLKELGIEHDRIFFETGWEHPWTYEHLRGPLTEKLGPIQELRADPLFTANQLAMILTAIEDLPLVKAEFWGGSPMVALVLKKGMFPAGIKARWCTETLKREVALRHFEGLISGGLDVVNVVGIRADESAGRALQPEWETLEWGRRGGLQYDVEVYRPVLNFSIEDVIAIHQRHNVPPNKLYLQGGIERVGCAPCINERKSGIRALADLWPERFDLIRELEVAVGRIAAIRLDGQEIREPNWTPPAWFRATGQGCIPIDQVIKWSRTKRGGKVEDKQELLFARHNDGCARWGLCDTGTTSKH